MAAVLPPKPGDCRLAGPVGGAGVARIAAFFCLVLICLVVVNHVINKGLRRIKTSSFGVSNQIMVGHVNADIVISGSSRALTHYDPRIIQEKTGRTAFNIGRNGSQTDMQLAFLKAYLGHNAKPSLVIQNLDLYSLVTTREVFDPVQYLPYLREDAIYQALVKINPEKWKSRFIPLYGYAVEDMRFSWLVGLKGYFGWNPPQDHHLGFLPRYTSWTGDFERFKAMNPDGVRFDIEPEGIRDLDELVALCKQRAIPVLLVYSPVYHEMQVLERNKAEVFTHFEEIRKRYDAILWDYCDSPISRNRDYFYNSQHLNADGASAFSTDLATRIASDPAFGNLSKAMIEPAK